MYPGTAQSSPSSPPGKPSLLRLTPEVSVGWELRSVLPSSLSLTHRPKCSLEFSGYPYQHFHIRHRTSRQTPSCPQHHPHEQPSSSLYIALSPGQAGRHSYTLVAALPHHHEYGRPVADQAAAWYSLPRWSDEDRARQAYSGPAYAPAHVEEVPPASPPGSEARFG
jgi:hypothetical protein